MPTNNPIEELVQLIGRSINLNEREVTRTTLAPYLTNEQTTRYFEGERMDYLDRHPHTD